jgi:hypothetical protein
MRYWTNRLLQNPTVELVISNLAAISRFVRPSSASRIILALRTMLAGNERDRRMLVSCVLSSGLIVMVVVGRPFLIGYPPILLDTLCMQYYCQLLMGQNTSN